MSVTYNCIIQEFSITDAFDAVNVLSELEYDSVSCAEKNKSWFVEVLDHNPINIEKIVKVLKLEDNHAISSGTLPDEDWLAKCFENFKPIVVDKFFIYGPHLRNRPVPSDKIGIEIAAATAFGTGEHPTTNRCLRAIHTFLNVHKYENMLDLGCGSCVLSIAAAKMGMKNIFAYDNVAESVRVSIENTIINRVAHRIRVKQNKKYEFNTRSYDFIVSNILATPLIEMYDAITDSLNPRGLLILSGFTSNDNSVLNRYMRDGKFELLHRYDYKEWTTLVLQKIAFS